MLHSAFPAITYSTDTSLATCPGVVCFYVPNSVFANVQVHLLMRTHTVQLAVHMVMVVRGGIYNILYTAMYGTICNTLYEVALT